MNSRSILSICHLGLMFKPWNTKMLCNSIEFVFQKCIMTAQNLNINIEQMQYFSVNIILYTYYTSVYARTIFC